MQPMMQPTMQMPISGGTSNTHNAISTLCVSYLMKKFNFDTLYYGIMHGLVLTVLSSLVTYDFSFDFSWTDYIYSYLYYAPILPILAAGIYYFAEYCKKYYQKDYVVIKICHESYLKNVITYIRLNPTFYDIFTNTNIGDLDKKSELLLYKHDQNVNSTLDIESRYVFQDINCKVNFTDTFLNIEGYYTWQKDTRDGKSDDGKNDKRIVMKYMEFNILKKNNVNIDPTEVITKMTTFVNDINKDKINLDYIKVIKGQDGKLFNHTITFHSGTREAVDVLEAKIMKPFFHQERDRLWSVIKNTCLNPDFYKQKGQVPRISLLLHGPPGTGKSSFAYRIAMCLSRSVISLDLRELKRQEIYQILQNPTYTNCDSYKKAVFLFEEFDISINELYLREQQTKLDDDKYYNKMNNLYEKLEKLAFVSDVKEDDEEKSLKHKNRYENDHKEFKIRDLLELFQGAVPFESMIILANTNKFDEINTMCPALFRNGRMTPVHFGYIDSDTLQDISKYFFKEKMSGYIPTTLNISTSQIIELAFEALTYDKEPFKYFNDHMQKLMK